MKIKHNLSTLPWTLTGCTPYLWMMSDLEQISRNPAMEVPAIPSRVPGSVQCALLSADLLPDWNQGLNARDCEWVENRHWIFGTVLPDDWVNPTTITRLICQGLDDRGWIYLNGKEAGRFKGAHVPYIFDLSTFLRPTDNRLQIIFDIPPRWLGQFGYTSAMTDWKPRFYYTWDWVSRLVQIGIWDEIMLETGDGAEITQIDLNSHYDPIAQFGQLRVSCHAKGTTGSAIDITLSDGDFILAQQNFLINAQNSAESSTHGIAWDGLPVEAWWPNGLGSQKLYTLTCQLLSANGQVLDQQFRQIGFKSVEWRSCEGAPDGADPWICVVNQQPLFLQGVNWTPIRPNFADVSDEDYQLRLTLYRDLGINVLRVWGGATLEKSIFYTLCDELGLLVWQEFPLSSSGVENWPPEDENSLSELSRIAASYLQRCKHHACLLMWGGGNELQGGLDGSKIGIGRPVDLSHPLIARFAEIVSTRDPEHRFVATSSTGPRFNADRADFGKGLHWDVHGPWKADPDLAVWKSYWDNVDALFHSEVGAPGASPVDVILETCGALPALPVDETNPIWSRTSWWIEANLYTQELGHPPASLEAFVAWSQDRQAKALSIVAAALKYKFPRVGGVIFWMGHDCFPCTANTSIIDFYGRPKPAALALREIFKS